MTQIKKVLNLMALSITLTHSAQARETMIRIKATTGSRHTSVMLVGLNIALTLGAPSSARKLIQTIVKVQ